jgi:hypothetical protein
MTTTPKELDQNNSATERLALDPGLQANPADVHVGDEDQPALAELVRLLAQSYSVMPLFP